ncbi:MAG: carboxymuconolactone decarboxylase family protein [Promethearchaeota archaeon]
MKNKNQNQNKTNKNISQISLRARYFNRRSYNLRNFISDVSIAIRNMPAFIKSLKSKKISPSFAEKIMMAVTAVNKCPYCSWFHTKTALTAGCTPEEIRQIMSFEFNSCADDEMVALVFAQHYAESECHPSKDAIKRLVQCYRRDGAITILNYIHMITIGNLTGNTLDAFISRLKKIPPKPGEGSLIFEFIVLLLGFPLIPLVKRKKRA